MDQGGDTYQEGTRQVDEQRRGVLSTAKDYNRGFGIIRHNSPKVAANDLYTYESKLFLRTIDNF